MAEAKTLTMSPISMLQPTNPAESVVGALPGPLVNRSGDRTAPGQSGKDQRDREVANKNHASGPCESGHNRIRSNNWNTVMRMETSESSAARGPRLWCNCCMKQRKLRPPEPPPSNEAGGTELPRSVATKASLRRSFNYRNDGAISSAGSGAASRQVPGSCETAEEVADDLRRV
jgi:hypothetical protein